MTLKATLLASAVLSFLLSSDPTVATEMQIVTHDPDTSSSRCIGEPKTPLCAIETAWACQIWGKKSLCAAVGIPEDYAEKEWIWHTDDRRGANSLYQVIDSKTLTQTDIDTFFSSYSEFPLYPGDVIVRLWEAQCHTGGFSASRLAPNPKLSMGDFPPFRNCSRYYKTRPDDVVVRPRGTGWGYVPHHFLPNMVDEFWQSRN
jgi:hypothetical protein